MAVRRHDGLGGLEPQNDGVDEDERHDGALGARIDGIDLARCPDDAAMAELRKALLDHCVLLLPGQGLITPEQHVDVQAAAQKWVDSSISKTANVPSDFKYENFKNIYLYAYEQGLKGCTTFRFNPEAQSVVLVTEQDLKNTTYVFTLEDGTEVSVRGDEKIEYDGETHTASNLFDALKEGYYGKF